MDDDKEAQTDELLALASIYEEGTFSAAEDGSGGQFSAHIQLSLPFFVNLDGFMVDQVKRAGVKTHQEGNSTHLSVQYLPPIVINFQYPNDYPSCSAPAFTLSCKWLSVYQLSRLCEKLDELWLENSNEVILFTWTQSLIDESLDILDLTSPISLEIDALIKRISRQTSRQTSHEGNSASSCQPDVVNTLLMQAANEFRNSGVERTPAGVQDQMAASPFPSASFLSSTSATAAAERTNDPRTVQNIGSVRHLILSIIEHDRAERQKAFNVAMYCCNVCFSEKQGVDCINFMGCDHVYCKQCMKEYFKVQIAEGNVNCLNCPETKCDSQALPSQVRELVGQELFATYDRLLLQQSLEGMEDIVYCPRLTCQSPVLLEKESTMGVCASCKLAFCLLCKKTYHGGSPCALRSEELGRVLSTWREGSKDTQQRLEKRYGHDVIMAALRDDSNIFCLSLEQLSKVRQQWEEGDPEVRKDLEKRYGRKNLIQAVEENYSMEWMKRFSKKCPVCKTAIEKIDGCNKMVCLKCRSYFCWLCMSLVSKSNPYEHFNNPSSPCFNLLFRGVEADNEDWFEFV